MTLFKDKDHEKRIAALENVAAKTLDGLTEVIQLLRQTNIKTDTNMEFTGKLTGIVAEMKASRADLQVDLVGYQ